MIGVIEERFRELRTDEQRLRATFSSHQQHYEDKSGTKEY